MGRLVPICICFPREEAREECEQFYPFFSSFSASFEVKIRFTSDSWKPIRGICLKGGEKRNWGRISLTSREKAAGIRNPRKRPSARGPNRNNCRRFTRCSTALLPSYVRALRAFSRPHYCPHRGHEDRPQRPARQRTSCVPAPVVQIPRAGNFVFPPPPPFAKKENATDSGVINLAKKDASRE